MIPTFSQKQQLGKYIIVSFKGAGAFGETYQVLHTGLNKIRAIKFSKPIENDNQINSILTEAEVQVTFEHDYIVKVYDVDKYQDDKSLYLYIDMEYMPNGSLGSLMHNDFISIKTAVVIFEKILFALEYMHEKGYLHRDIKPDNILLDTDCSPKLSDFGLSNTVEECLKNPNGYTTHLAPEWFTNKKSTFQTDIYAAGITLFRIINNYSNWKEVLKNSKINIADVYKGKIIEKVGYMPWIPEKLKRIVNKATNKSPQKRYKTISELKNALAKFSIKYDWNPIENGWEGVSDKIVYNIKKTYKTRLKQYYITIMKNNRKIKELKCDCKQEANQMIFEFIKDSYNEQ